MGIKITVRTFKTIDVGDPETHEWRCGQGHLISPSDVGSQGHYDFQDQVWFHEVVGCMYPMHMYTKD